MTFKKNTQIYGATILDGVPKGMENAYSLRARDLHKEEDLILSVKVHHGAVKILIDCDITLWDYLIQRGSSKEIVLGQEKCSTGNYFFRVNGERSSVYSLRAVERKSNQLELGKGSSVTGEILPQEKITYELLIPLFAAEEVFLDLHSQKSLDLNITLCRFLTDCPGIFPAENQYKITNYYGFNNLSIEEFNPEENPSDRLKINPHKFGCYPIIVQDQISLPVCAYLITLSNNQPSSVEFTLTPESKRPNLLQISEPYSDIIAQNTSVYFALYLPYKNIESVQVQYTKFFGDFDIFISNSTKYPNHQEDSPNFQFSPEGLIIIKNTSEVYYIGLHALKTSSFSISAVITLPNREYSYMSDEWAFSLNPGKPQKGVLLSENVIDLRIYKILLAQDDDWEGTLCIQVHSYSEKLFLIVNNNGRFPTGNHMMWSSFDQKLEISSSDSKFKKQGAYYVGVFFPRYSTDTDLLPDIPFHITYSLKDKDLFNSVHTFVSPNAPFFGVIKQGESHYFESLLLDGESPLSILDPSSSKNITLYISTDSSNKYPSQNAYTLATTEHLTLTSEACKTRTALGCSVYFTVISTGDQPETYYSLDIRSDFYAVYLPDGQEIHSIIPPKSNGPAVFYYGIRSEHSVITVNCPGREVVIYAKRFQHSQKSLGQSWKEALTPIRTMLDEKTAEFTGATYVSVPPLLDSNIIIIAVSVYFKEAQEGSTTFTIFQSTKITQLAREDRRSGNVLQGQYIYFMVNVTNPECTLSVVLSNYEHSKEADLVISYGENTRPTISANQFAVISPQKQRRSIEINKAQLSPGSSMSGIWVIGVYGSFATSFVLNVISEDQKIVYVRPGNPIKMALEESSGVYFQYFHQSKSHLQINLTEFSGHFNIFVTSVEKNRDFETYLPSQSNYKWQISSTGSQQMITIPMQDHKACVFCFYIMKIEAVSLSEFSFVVNEFQDILPIGNLFRFSGTLTLSHGK